MAREIKHQPWTKEFEEEVYHTQIPALEEALKPAQRSWESWLTAAGIGLAGTAVVLGLFAEPLLPVAVAVAGVTVAKDVGLESLKCYSDWKDGKTQNGLHYLLRLKQQR
jgi:hypothetical protein